MKLEDLIGLLVPATYLLMRLVESRVNHRSFPKIRGWDAIGIGFLLLIGSLSTVIPLVLPTDWLARHRLLEGSRLGVVGGVLVGWLALSLVSYLWHRNAHRRNWFWRTFHQLHHSPIRLDIPGSVLFHPLEICVQTLLAVGVSVFILGLDPRAAALVGYVQAFHGMFQHWNVPTPTWLGYLIQRPEAHGVHHQRGVHAYNYSDFPLWDILAGSFRNPPSFTGEVGFEPSAARRFWAMLATVDVHGARPS